MPNTREKLIEKINTKLMALPYGEITLHTAEEIADRLIEDGYVTDTNVGKWISVKDRLPEPGVWVLAVDKYGIEASVLRYHDWDDYWEAQHGEGCPGDLISYWMLLPELPIELQEEE